jgi:hypothetical protein
MSHLNFNNVNCNYDNSYEKTIINRYFSQEATINKILNCSCGQIDYKLSLVVKTDIHTNSYEKKDTINDILNCTCGQQIDKLPLNVKTNKIEIYNDAGETAIAESLSNNETDDDVNDNIDNICSECNLYKFSNVNMRCPSHTLKTLYELGL